VSSEQLGPVRWGLVRRKVRLQRRRLSFGQRGYLDGVTSEIFSEAGSEAEFAQFFEAKVRHDSQTMGFDPMTILLMIELAMLIYKLLKHFNVLTPTPEYVAFLIDEDE
jgi:hypothetical protein